MDDTSYKGASLSAKELLSWRPLRHSADVELDGELSTLVARSRDLIRNNGIASGAIQTLVDNVIGNGLKLVSIPDHRILGLDLDYLEEWARKVESLCLNSRLFHLLKKLWLRFLTLKLLFQVRKPPKM